MRIHAFEVDTREENFATRGRVPAAVKVHMDQIIVYRDTLN